MPDTPGTPGRNATPPATPPPTPPPSPPSPPPPTHTPVVWDGTIKPPNANVAKELHKISLHDQRKNAQTFFDFLERDGDGSYLAFNEANNAPMAALYQLPAQKMVRLFYMPGYGANGVLQHNNGINGKVLGLTLDGGEATGPPNPVLLPNTVLKKATVPAMTEDLFTNAITTAGATYTYPLLRKNQVTANTVDIYKIAPIPPYLVYDGFGNDLDAAEVLERVLGSADTNTSVFTHLKEFLRAVLTSQNNRDPKPHISLEESHIAITAPAKEWAKTKFHQQFPTLQSTTESTRAPTTALDPVIAKLLDELAAARRATQTVTMTTAEEKKEDDRAPKLSSMETKQLLRMCGFDEHADPKLLPEWIQKCQEPNMSKAMKTQVVQKLLNQEMLYFDDAELYLTSAFIQSIVDRNWMGKDGLRPSFITAMEGLSPFAMKSRSHDEIAKLNQELDIKNEATNKSMEELRKQRNKAVPEIPTSHHELLRWLKRFGNLLHLLFESNCPLFTSIEVIIRNFHRCSITARQRMTSEHMCCMLWIILLQSREFAIGNTAIISEFKDMLQMIQSKDLRFYHAECPLESFIPPKPENDKKRPATDAYGNSNSLKHDTRTKVQKVDIPWHPELKKCLEAPLKQHAKDGYPPKWGKILNYCGLRQIPGMNNTEACIPFMATNYCQYGKMCHRKHTTATDTQAEQLKKALKKFITEPDDFKQG